MPCKKMAADWLLRRVISSGSSFIKLMKKSWIFSMNKNNQKCFQKYFLRWIRWRLPFFSVTAGFSAIRISILKICVKPIWWSEIRSFRWFKIRFFQRFNFRIFQWLKIRSFWWSKIRSFQWFKICSFQWSKIRSFRWFKIRSFQWSEIRSFWWFKILSF
mgnify:CR=1 FL=1